MGGASNTAWEIEYSKLRKEETVRRGNYGTVCKAWHQNEMVAVKVYFQPDEIQVFCLLGQHQNIVAIDGLAK
jgi:hypothetical protein